MKRRDRILAASLQLFNEQGENRVSSVDIANELDISPGNLYYHFHGKEALVAELAGLFASRVDLWLATMLEETDLTGRWACFYGLLETLYRFRFLLRNISDLVDRYPEGGRRLVKSLALVRESLLATLGDLAESGAIGLSGEQRHLIARLVKSIMLVIINGEGYRYLDQSAWREDSFVQDTSLQVLSLLAPYLDDNQVRELHQVHQAYLRSVVAEDND